MPRKDCCGSDTSRPDMGIMDGARGNGVPIGKNGFHVAMMFLLLGLLLSILNVPVACGAREVVTAPAAPPPVDGSQNPPIAPSPASQDLSPSPFPPPLVSPSPPPPPPPPPTLAVPPAAISTPPRPEATPPLSDSPPPPPAFDSPLPPPPAFDFPPPPTFQPPPPAVGAFPPPPPSTIANSGNTWNESEKAGVVIASIAALLQVAVVAFLLIKRHQMLTTVEYDDIDDLEYDNPRDPNFRHTESV